MWQMRLAADEDGSGVRYAALAKLWVQGQVVDAVAQLGAQAHETAASLCGVDVGLSGRCQ